MNPTAQQPAPATLAAPMPPGFRGVQPPVVGTEASPPTSWPTPTPDGQKPPPRGAGDTYAVVAAGDIPTLFEALCEAAQLNIDQPGVPYKIYLAAGEYQLSQSLVVFGTVEIYGAGMTATTLRQIGLPGSQSGSMNTMIKLPGKSLTIDNLTLVDGATDYRGGAINVENINAVLTVTNSKFLNNHADNTGEGSGGAIYSVGQVFLEKVYFQGNTSREGGALSNASPITDFAVDAYNVDFQANSASTARGGAIYNAADKIKVQQSNFRGNSSTAGSDVRKHTHSYLTASVTINARLNYWYNPVVPASANANGVNTLDLLAAKVNFTLDAPQTPPPDPCGTRQCPVPTSTPTPTLSVSLTPTTGNSISGIVSDMTTYGITVYPDGVDSLQSNGQAWALQELQELQEAVRDVARVFNNVRYQSDSGISTQARNLFRNVMKQITSGANLRILRVTNSFTFGNGDPCDGTLDAGCTSNGNTTIALYGSFALEGTSNANYTIVHELGHRFDNQSGTNGIEGLRLRMDGESVIKDCFSYPDPNFGQRVMGTYFDATFPMDWNRGSRGWGSSGHSLFQQNILEIIDTTIPPPPPAPPPPGIDETLELSEAAADMFLNWIYRRSTDGAVEESSDETARCTTQMEIGSWLGFRNIDGNGNYDTTLPGNARFWWMEEQLRQIFQEQSDWD